MNPEIGFMGQMTTKDILKDIDFAIENDFDWFEIALDWRQNFNLSDKTIGQIKNKASNNNLQLIVHTPYFLPTSAMIPEIRQGVFKNVEKAINLANQVESDRLTIHPGFREIPGREIEVTYNSLINNLKRIVSMGREKGVDICLENFDNYGANLCSQLEDFNKVLGSVPDIKVTLDIGHTNTTDTSTVEYFKKTSRHIMDMHIHDNDGSKDQHVCIGEGNIDFNRLFKKCQETEYYGPFILELFPYKNISRGREKFIEIWEKT